MPNRVRTCELNKDRLVPFNNNQPSGVVSRNLLHHESRSLNLQRLSQPVTNTLLLPQWCAWRRKVCSGVCSQRAHSTTAPVGCCSILGLSSLRSGMAMANCILFVKTKERNYSCKQGSLNLLKKLLRLSTYDLWGFWLAANLRAIIYYHRLCLGSQVLYLKSNKEQAWCAVAPL